MTTQYRETVNAIRGMREGADRWTLADALASEVPQSASRRLFKAVAAATEAAGVKPLGESAMRQYRDTAVRWPKASRIPGVSFSAHRTAMAGDDPVKIIRDLIAQHGIDGVTVSRIRDLIAIQTNQPTAAQRKASASASASLASASASDLAGALLASSRTQRKATLEDLRGMTIANLTELVKLATEAKAKAKRSQAKRQAWSPKADRPKADKADAGRTAIPKRKRNTSEAGDIRGL